jgi:uncharacterized membrane protein
MTRKTPAARRFLLLGLALGLGAGCEHGTVEPATLTPDDVVAAKKPATAYRYTVLNVPDAFWTQAYRMNARGDVVGFYQDAEGMHGFLLRRGSYERLRFPDAVMTHPRGINERGDIVGDYILNGRTHGFVLSNGRYATLNMPDAFGTRLWDINANGEISGEFQAAAGGAWHGFIWRKGDFRTLDIPEATMSAGFGINVQGEVVGHYRLPAPGGGVTKMLGFIWRNGVVTQLDYPAENLMSCAMGISSHVVLGHFWDVASGIVYGYVWQGGEFIATLRVPDARDTYPTSITPSGTIAGYHWDAEAGSWRGFVAEPLNPSGR